MRRAKSRALTAVLVVSLIAGCVSKPPRLTVAEERDLIWLEAHGYTRDGFNPPKNTAFAVLIDILPLPGIGQFYLGYVGDGLKMMLLSWLFYPFIVAPIDAYRKSSYRNDEAYLEYAREKGWLVQPESRKPVAPTDPRANEQPSTADQASQPTQASQPSTSVNAPVADPARSSGTTEPRPGFCSQCGAKVDGNFCTACGAKRTTSAGGPAEVQKKCSSCGELRPADAEICPHCGLK